MIMLIPSGPKNSSSQYGKFNSDPTNIHTNRSAPAAAMIMDLMLYSLIFSIYNPPFVTSLTFTLKHIYHLTLNVFGPNLYTSTFETM